MVGKARLQGKNYTKTIGALENKLKITKITLTLHNRK